MTKLSVLMFGIGLGFRHAADADHVVVVTTLVQSERGAWRAARMADYHPVTFDRLDDARQGQLRHGIASVAALLSIGLGMMMLKEGLFGGNSH